MENKIKKCLNMNIKRIFNRFDTVSMCILNPHKLSLRALTHVNTLCMLAKCHHVVKLILIFNIMHF